MGGLFYTTIVAIDSWHYLLVEHIQERDGWPSVKIVIGKDTVWTLRLSKFQR